MAERSERQAECMLCGKSKDQVKKLVVGRDGSVCSDCVELCHESLHRVVGGRNPDAFPAAEYELRDRCNLCGLVKDPVTELIVGVRGAICDDCVEKTYDLLHPKR